MALYLARDTDYGDCEQSTSAKTWLFVSRKKQNVAYRVKTEARQMD